MNHEKELNSRILAITMIIAEKFPELSKYIGEMPVTIPDAADPEINVRNLQDYYNSLDALLKRYTMNHISTTK